MSSPLLVNTLVIRVEHTLSRWRPKQLHLQKTHLQIRSYSGVLGRHECMRDTLLPRITGWHPSHPCVEDICRLEMGQCWTLVERAGYNPQWHPRSSLETVSPPPLPPTCHCLPLLSELPSIHRFVFGSVDTKEKWGYKVPAGLIPPIEPHTQQKQLTASRSSGHWLSTQALQKLAGEPAVFRCSE